ncbi:MAG: hypothetical protein F6K63_23405 [Moorea sp. SIO1G6]|uniref:hypothetical protein n=1 Tax=Moorena sp. SIO1G6 TaxID=2607840 RepID=UPI0013C0CC8C|nr:hypothetical protein [Moorena sp. SIO1G6]NET67171.1 hypothetical protein [Moorena sp. SIO1G6]
MLQAYAKPEDLQKVTTMSDKFISDESNHIGYYAYCIRLRGSCPEQGKADLGTVDNN